MAKFLVIVHGRNRIMYASARHVEASPNAASVALTGFRLSYMQSPWWCMVRLAVSVSIPNIVTSHPWWIIAIFPRSLQSLVVQALVMLRHAKLVYVCALMTCIGLVLLIDTISARDPTSIFFDPRKGYQPRYSELRRKQATEYIAAHNTTELSGHPRVVNPKKKLCVGVPSMGRRGAQYIPDAIGSLLEGLTVDERSDFLLMVFIPHTDPTTHPSYGEAWLHDLTDHVLIYDLDESDKDDLRVMEEEGGAFLTKGLYDYTYLLSKCIDQDTPYIAILEDDTIAMDGWFHRTVAAIREAERQTELRCDNCQFLYLRLFYTETLMGWNSEEWAIYLYWSLIAAGALAVFILVLHKIKSLSKLCRSLGPQRAILLAYSGLMVAILLFFALGRMTVLPIPPGISEMNKFGCCSQALVFPRQKALELVSFFGDRRAGFADVLIEEFAGQRSELRFAVTPSLVQHVGLESSKRTGDAPVIREGIWNFRFERFDAEQLKTEHEFGTNKKLRERAIH